jgi:hypothetical protein
MLIRIACIDKNSANAYHLQDSFARNMPVAINQHDRIRLAGHLFD